MSLEKKTELIGFHCNKCNTNANYHILGKCSTCGSFDTKDIEKVWVSEESILELLNQLDKVSNADVVSLIKNRLRNDNKEFGGLKK